MAKTARLLLEKPVDRKIDWFFAIWRLKNSLELRNKAASSSEIPGRAKATSDLLIDIRVYTQARYLMKLILIPDL